MWMLKILRQNIHSIVLPIPILQIFPDNFAKREILNYSVHCKNFQSRGCEWLGPLSKLQVMFLIYSRRGSSLHFKGIFRQFLCLEQHVLSVAVCEEGNGKPRHEIKFLLRSKLSVERCLLINEISSAYLVLCHTKGRAPMIRFLRINAMVSGSSPTLAKISLRVRRVASSL